MFIILDTIIFYRYPESAHKKVGKKSFSYAAAVIWNSFPDEFKKSE